MKQVASSPLQMQKGGGASKACQSNSSSAEQGETDDPVSAASVHLTCTIEASTGARMHFVLWSTLKNGYVIHGTVNDHRCSRLY